MKQVLEKHFLNKDITKIESFFKTEKLEQLTNGLALIVKIFDHLESSDNFDSILAIINSISIYKIKVMQDELSEGVKILIKNKKTKLCLDFIITNAKNNKMLDEYLVIQIIKMCLDSSQQDFSLDALVLEYFQIRIQNKMNYSHILWSTVIEGYFALDNKRNVESKFVSGYEFLKIYPFKTGYSEIIWKKLLSNKSDIFIKLFEILLTKYNKRGNEDEVSSIEATFNYALESSKLAFNNMNDKLEYLKFFSLAISKIQVNFKENIIEEFLIWIINQYPEDFNVVKYFIIVFDLFLTSNIICKIVNEYSKIGRIEYSYKTLCLCKSKNISVMYESLVLDNQILNEIFIYMSNNLIIDFNSSHIANLTNENYIYARSHFTEGNEEHENSNSQRLISGEEAVKNYTKQLSNQVNYINDENKKDILASNKEVNTKHSDEEINERFEVIDINMFEEDNTEDIKRNKTRVENTDDINKVNDEEWENINEI